MDLLKVVIGGSLMEILCEDYGWQRDESGPKISSLILTVRANALAQQLQVKKEVLMTIQLIDNSASYSV